MSVSPATSRISLGSELLRLLHPAAAAALRANFLGGTTGILGLITTVFARRPASRFSVRNGNTGLPSGQYLYPLSLSLSSSATLISYSLSRSLPPSSLTIPRHRHLRHQIIATLSSPSSTSTLSSPTFFHPTSYGLSPTSFVILTTIPPPYPPPLTSEWILTSSLSTPN